MSRILNVRCTVNLAPTLEALDAHAELQPNALPQDVRLAPAW